MAGDDGGGDSKRVCGGGSFVGGPITGAEYTQWSDRLRDVEEILDVPELRAQAAQIRDRASQLLDRLAGAADWLLVLQLGAVEPDPDGPRQPSTLLAAPLFHVSGALPLVSAPVMGTRLVFPPVGQWDEITHLRTDNATLRDQLARSLGQHRAHR